MPIRSDSTIDGELMLVRTDSAAALPDSLHRRFLLRIGATIKTCRKCRGLSVAQLSRETGVSATTLRDVEAGVSDLRVSVLCAIEVTLGVAPGWVIRTSL